MKITIKANGILEGKQPKYKISILWYRNCKHISAETAKRVVLHVDIHVHSGFTMNFFFTTIFC